MDASRGLTVGLVIDAVGRSLLNQFKQAVFVYGSFTKHFAQSHPRRKTEWLFGVRANFPCPRGYNLMIEKSVNRATQST